ncbi:hypothetical protein ScPMuIL_004248 [Solemya velum]
MDQESGSVGDQGDHLDSKLQSAIIDPEKIVVTLQEPSQPEVDVKNAHDVVPLIDKLHQCSNQEEQIQLLDQLIDILTLGEKDESVDTEDISVALVDQGLLDILLKFLCRKHVKSKKVAQLIAEIAKTECLREPCVEKGFVPQLLHLLESDDITKSTQGCRALGNICYENDLGREAVDAANGIHTLLQLLRSNAKTEGAESNRLRTIACGFLLNLTNTHDLLQQKAIEDEVFGILDQYLLHHYKEDSLCNMVLLTVGSITESECCKDALLQSTLCKSIIEVLELDVKNFHRDTILELLIGLADWDEVKDALSETNLSNQLIRIIQLNTGLHDDESQQSVKMASDLLVLLLTGDKSMEVLFGDGEGPVFVESVKWLESDNHHLQLSGALALGNFARNDVHCQRLVEEGIVDRLLVLLKPVVDKEGNVTLLHAVLSALRNLAIPATNKPQLLKAGVLDAVLKVSTTDVMAVVFKLLGVLRMLVDGQEEAAMQLGMDREFLVRLAEWCAVEEHAGVKGEATRLLAWLVKNSRSSDVMRLIIRAEGIPHLVSMTTSEHIVMQNEALVALTLITTAVLADAAVALKEADLTETITSLLRDEQTLPEIVCNTLTLTKSICAAGTLREELVASGLINITKDLSKHGDQKVQEAASSLLAFITEMQIDR